MDVKDKEELFQWASENYSEEIERRYFTRINQNQDSYYIKKIPDEYLKEYDYQTLSDLKNELHKLWGDEPVMSEMIQKAAVIAMKNKRRSGYMLSLIHI